MTKVFILIRRLLIWKICCECCLKLPTFAATAGNDLSVLEGKETIIKCSRNQKTNFFLYFYQREVFLKRRRTLIARTWWLWTRDQGNRGYVHVVYVCRGNRWDGWDRFALRSWWLNESNCWSVDILIFFTGTGSHCVDSVLVSDGMER